MKDYYEILEINKDATMQEIKKAYFKMVRKFPPDKYQKEFKEIREAYEILNDEGTRSEFDRMYSLSPTIRQNLFYAKECMKGGNYAKAISALNEILKIEPNTHFVKALLGEAYLENGNTGKAAKAFEELVDENPDNPSFINKLADSYIKRGWQKKAIEAYERSIKIDKDNVSTWIDLSDAYIMNSEMGKAAEVLKDAVIITEDFDLRLSIYVRLIFIYMNHQIFNQVISYLDKMVQEVEGREDEKENLTAYIVGIAIGIADQGHYEYAKQAIKKATEISPQDENVSEIVLKIEKMEKYNDEFWRAERDRRIPPEIIQLFGFEIYNDEYDELDEQAKSKLKEFNEGMVASDYGSSFKKAINIIKEQYPALYALKEQFFVSLENIGKRNKMIDRCMKLHRDVEKIMNVVENAYDAYDDEFDEEDDFDFEPQEPIVREEPKIGRNDPCPCGSGKKYKKCCGK